MTSLNDIVGDLASQAHDPAVQSKIGEMIQSALNSPQAQAVTQQLDAALAKTPYGGIQGVVNALHESGLTAHVQSWLSGGPNTPIDAQKVQQALAPGLDAIGNALGLPQNTLSHVLAQALPPVVDKMSNDGTVTAPPASAPAA